VRTWRGAGLGLGQETAIALSPHSHLCLHMKGMEVVGKKPEWRVEVEFSVPREWCGVLIIHYSSKEGVAEAGTVCINV
jgi:hypothetical protein